MSLTTLCGRCFVISCSTDHSTSWLRDHRLPLSLLRSGTSSTSMGSRSQLQERAVCTRSTSSAYAWPICWRTEPQRHAVLYSRESGFAVLVSHGALCRVGTCPSVLPSACYSSFVNTRLAAVDANHLHENPVSEGPTAVGPGAARRPLESEGSICSALLFPVAPASSTPALQPLSPITPTSTFRQSSYLDTATLTRAADLAGPACQRGTAESCLGACVGPTCLYEFFRGYTVAGTRVRAMLEGFVDDFPQTRPVVDDLRSGRPTCGFSGDVVAHFRRQWLQHLGRSVSPPPA